MTWGGGIGTFLKSAQEVFQIKDENLLLVEGDHVEEALLQIPKSQYKKHNLEQPYFTDRRFDLAISLEVAEHLCPERAESFVHDLCALSDVILFSAAYLKQGGNHHVNEKPLIYWMKLFKENGYVAHDVIRPYIQFDYKIPFWYRQNTLLYTRSGSKTDTVIQAEEISSPPLDMILYEMVETRLQHYEYMMQSPLIRAVWKLVRKRRGI